MKLTLLLNELPMLEVSFNDYNDPVTIEKIDSHFEGFYDAWIQETNYIISHDEQDGGYEGRTNGLDDIRAFEQRIIMLVHKFGDGWHYEISEEGLYKGGAGSGSWEGSGQPRFAWTQTQQEQKPSAPQQLADVAHGISEQAKQIEPKLTKTIDKLALKTGGVIRGKEWRLKREESIIRKMQEEYRANPNLKPEEVGKEIRDSVRYTLEFDEAKYTASAQTALNDLQKEGQIPVGVRNYWQPGDPYQGINVTMRSPEGHQWELQFHTSKSYNLKQTELHPIYEQFRVSPNPADRKTMWQKMVDLSDKVSAPAGVLGIGVLATQVFKAIAEGIRYFAFTTAKENEFSGMFRMRQDNKELSFEYIDSKGKWNSDPELASFLLGSEGAQEISADKSEELANDWFKVKKGGSGSGNFGHAGREGEVGGSSSDGGSANADVGASTAQEVKEFTSLATKYSNSNKLTSPEANGALAALGLGGGSELTFQARTSATKMGHYLEDTPELINLVPEKDRDFLIQILEQNNSVAHAAVTEYLASKKSTVSKGGAGSGSWEAPGQPRFAYEGSQNPPPASVVNAKAFDAAQQYLSSQKMTLIGDQEKVKVDPERGKKLAEAYEQMKSDPKDPAVIEAYTQFGKEVQAQYDVLPVKVEWTPADPYKSSKDMVEDVVNNGNLKVFTGGDPHPLLGTKDKEGISLNDKFRAVHDYFGHSMRGNQFGPSGEENAWIDHSRMFSPLAQKAMTTETRGQNSWFNFSKTNEGKEPKDRQFAEQKVGILPDEFLPSAKQKRASDNKAVQEGEDPRNCPLRASLYKDVQKGGGGSGNFGHSGRPGEVGGSAGDGGGKPDMSHDKPETSVPQKLTTFEGIKEHLGTGTKIIISAEKSNLRPEDNHDRSLGLKRILQNYSDDVIMQHGKYDGTTERSYVATVRPEQISDIRNLAFDKNELNQESVIVIRNGNAELHYADGRKEYGKIADLTNQTSANDNYSDLGGVRYHINFKERK